MNITVLFEDLDLLVIDKPAGVTVNKAETTRNEITIQDWAEKKLKIDPDQPRLDRGQIGDVDSDFYKRGGLPATHSSANKQNIQERDSYKFSDPVKDFALRAGVVHRLDKETSGVLLLAKNPSAFSNLQKQFKERTVKKVYNALAHGRITPSIGEINVPVGRLPWNRNRFGILPGGRESETQYKVLGYYLYSRNNQDISSSSERSESRSNNEAIQQFNNSEVSRRARTIKDEEILTLVELYPQSGRTHQIRVHLKYIGHPIFSDFLYAGRKTARADRKFLPRVFLHASKISFTHPSTAKELTFDVPLPSTLSSLLDSLTKVS